MASLAATPRAGAVRIVPGGNVIDQDHPAGEPSPVGHPNWCDRSRCTAADPDGLHIGQPTLVPLGEDPGDGATVQYIQAIPGPDKPDPAVRLGIRWCGVYARMPPIVIGLDRAQSFGEVLCRLARGG